MTDDDLERLRLDYEHADLSRFRNRVNCGEIDQEDFHLALIEGRRRHLTQDYQSSWDEKNTPWEKDVEGYDGFIKGTLRKDDDSDDDCLLS